MSSLPQQQGRRVVNSELKMLGELEANNSSGADMESRKRCLTSPGTAKNPGDVCATPPAKKLKQARLPFQPISSPPVTQICSASPTDRLSKKRKLSETDTDPSSPVESSTKLKDKINVTPSNKKSVTKPASKKTPSSAKLRVVKEPEPPVVEPEVSSSSEDVVAAAPAAKSPGKKKHKPLDRFLQTNQEPTSTSKEEVINLDEDEDKKNEGVSKSESKDEKLSSSDTKEVAVVSSKEISDSKDQDCEVSLISDDEASAGETSALDSSTASEASCNTSTDSEVGKPADSISEVTCVSSTPKNVIKPPRKTPLSAKAKKREQEKELKQQEKERLKEEKRQKAEKEKEEKKKQKEAVKAEREAKIAEAKRLKELEKEQKAEAKRLKDLEREQKAEAKRLKDLEKEQKMKEKLAKLEQDEKERQEKQEKQKDKIKELEAKNEEKKLKMEEKQKLEEEKKKEEESKRKAKEKQQSFFKSFFTKIETPAAPKEPKEKRCGGFVPFQIQKDMALAPVYGFDKLQGEDAKQKFDGLIKCQDAKHLYLNELKSKAIKPGRRAKTMVDTNENSEDSIQMVEDIKEQKAKTKAKLLQFHENYRPAYYGTWSKISSKISPRNYVKKDEDFLDYEFDSDEEWEEPGESLSDSEGEDSDGDSDGGDSDNDGFFVEHGYLSESEDPIDEDEDVEQWKAKRKAKALAWEIELKRQTQVLKPIIVGCVWLHGAQKNHSKFDQTKLEDFRAVTLVTVPIETSLSARKSPELVKDEGRSPTPNTLAAKSQKMPVPEEAMPDLIRLVHGNPCGIKSLTREFREYWRLQELKRSQPPDTTTTKSEESPATNRCESPKPTPPAATLATTSSATPSGNSSPDVDDKSPSVAAEANSTNSTPEETEKVYTISKRQLEKKIPSFAVREKRTKCYPRICWYVHPEMLEKYKLTDLPVPTQWVHQTGPLAVNRSDDAPIPYSLLPPQIVTSTPSSSARRIVPTKVGSPSSVLSMLQQQKPKANTNHANSPSSVNQSDDAPSSCSLLPPQIVTSPSSSARRIVPTKVNSPSSVLSMLQQQKTKAVTNHANLPATGQIVVDSSSAAGMLVNAAAICSAQQQQTANPAVQVTSTVTPPVVTLANPYVNMVPVTAQQVAIPTQDASGLEAKIQPKVVADIPEKPTKKVCTLDSFFSSKPKKAITQDKIKDNDVKVNLMEVTETESATVSNSISTKLNVAENNAENKMEVDAPNNNTVVNDQSKKIELGVIKDLLSQAKENRLKKQSSPARKKSPSKPSEATSSVAESTASSASSQTKDEPDIITLEPDIITLD